MSDPLVACIMLTKDRPKMAKRAVECFRSQTYQNKQLAICDTSATRNTELETAYRNGIDCAYGHAMPEGASLTIGELRNAINGTTRARRADILIHWDDDDWSHPNRISEQVALLQASGKQVVGYRDMLFWRENERLPRIHPEHGEAWLYANNDPRYCLGTSLCYTRETWEKRPFKALPTPGSTGEDHEFLRDRDTLGETSLFRFMGPSGSGHDDLRPRMIASIHGGNTSGQYANLQESHSWKRGSEFDELCRKTMVL